METPADGVDSEYCRDCDRCRPGAALAWVSDAGSDQNSLAAAASPLVRAVSIELSRLSGDNDLRQRRWRRGFEPTLSCGKHHDGHVTTRSGDVSESHPRPNPDDSRLVQMDKRPGCGFPFVRAGLIELSWRPASSKAATEPRFLWPLRVTGRLGPGFVGTAALSKI